LKHYEKHTFLRFFALLSAAFFLMFLLLGGLYYTQEKERLQKEVQITAKLQYIECRQLMHKDSCSEQPTAAPDLGSLHRNLIYAMLLVLFIFMPISLLLSYFSMRPVRKASIMIDNFIANIVHDINTPVSTILLNAKSLLKHPGKADTKLSRIISSAQQLEYMQHDLLALCDEKTAVETEEIDTKALIEELTGDFSLHYPAQRFELSLQVQKVTLNTLDLRRILQNLLSNAIKYNRDNHPIRIDNMDGNIHIIDRGKGIENPQKIFEKNYREDYTVQGNGLGLASVLAMAQRNSISIDVESTVGKGTHITLIFSLG
jgi:two-component system OmpR family sensor kinase